MSRIAITALSLAPRDAVSHAAQEMGRVLARCGHEIAFFSSHWFKKDPHTRDAGEAAAYLGDDARAVLIYHHAVGWPAGLELARRARCRRVVCYHNVTPPRFFAGYTGGYRRMCQEGREQLGPLARAGCELYLSDSAYNQDELLREGADPGRCVVVPPFHQVDRLLQAAPDPGVLAGCRDGAVNVLFVGRRAPNKGHRFLIDAFAAYVGHYQPRSRLFLVGKEDPALAGYTNRLREQASRLGVADRVVFVPEASEAALRAYYETADVFLLASEHEGFCVPLVEAMALGVPVVGCAATAVPETVGAAGILWEEPDPFLLAQSIDTLVCQPAVRRALAERGRRRYQEHFSNAVIARRFLGSLESLDARAA